MQDIINHIFTIKNDDDFSSLALEVFRYQASENPVYKEYLNHLRISASTINDIENIPFLPIEFFKSHRVFCGNDDPQLIFESSGTTGQKTSKHFVLSEALYRESFTTSFIENYDAPENLCILALLPSYLERGSSSLVYMMKHLIDKSQHIDSGFYLDEIDMLKSVLQRRVNDGHPTLLLGVSFALLDLAEKNPLNLSPNITVIETGGMKGRRKELIREELHNTLKEGFGVSTIHSEYGMTELLSQAYSKGHSRFMAPPWMKIQIRDTYDPFSTLENGRSGAINIIDLANLHSCSFIATGDLGKVYQNGDFEITGRFDRAEVRGCNLMVI